MAMFCRRYMGVRVAGSLCSLKNVYQPTRLRVHLPKLTIPAFSEIEEVIALSLAWKNVP